MRLTGLDHADVRVTSLASVEPFYDRVLPALGLTRKIELHVDRAGDWHDVDATHPRTAVEYTTPTHENSLGWFVGFVEDATCGPHGTRIAFALESEETLADVERLVRDAGGIALERSSEDDYPAIFFEDPAGTRLEICARRKRA